jgi:hypothetical protein
MSVRESVKLSGWVSLKTLWSDKAYHSFGGEVEARTPPRYAASSRQAVSNFWRYLVAQRREASENTANTPARLKRQNCFLDVRAALPTLLP